MSTRQSFKRGRKAKKIVGYYKCSSCQYMSDRYYNVTRHEFRIHSASSRRRHCCGMTFVTKGDHYVHCEEYHPHSRTGNLISRTKYKLIAGVVQTPGNPESSNQQIEEKVGRESRYALRTRAKASSTNDDRYEDSDFAEFSSDTSSSSEDTPTESNASSRESSGYGTKSPSFDVNRYDSRSESSNECSDTASDSSMKNGVEETKEFDESIHRENNLSTFYSQARDCRSINPDDIDTSFENSTKIGTPEIHDFRLSKDESKENLFSNVSASESLYLPIKKRILRDIQINDRRNVIESRNSIVERLHRRIKDEENRNKVIVCADPRISWHEFTEQHREYFECLLLDRSILDRFRQID